MKKTFPLFLAASMLLAACNSTTQSATGEVNYFVSEAPTAYQSSALGKVCFTPAQLDTINGGEMFCFTNTEEALTMFGVENPEECSSYWYGFAYVQIEALTTTAQQSSKSDTCFESGTCDFNTATLIQGTETSFGLKCATRTTDQSTYEGSDGLSFGKNDIEN